MIESLDIMLVGVYFFFGIYHLVVFGLGPKSRPYLFFGLGTLALSGFLFSLTGAANLLLPGEPFARGLGLLCLFLLYPAFLGLFDELARGAASAFTKVFSAVSAACAIVAPFLPREAVLTGWAIISIPPALYLVVFDLVLPIAAVQRDRGATGDAAARPSLAGEQPRGLSGLEFGLLAIGAAAAIGAQAFDLAVVRLGGEIAATKFAFLVMALAMAAVLAHQHRRSNERTEHLAANLEDTVSARTIELRTAMNEQSELNARLAAANLKLQNAMDIASKDMRIAVQVQQGILPSKPPATVDWEAAFVFQPVSGVSGDFYDFYVEGGRLKGLVVGDVSGHGIASGLVTILARSVFWRNFRGLADKSLGRILEQIDAELSKELSSVENYLTCAVLRIDGGSVEYVNAGHPEIAYRRAGKARAHYLAPDRTDDYKGPPIGREFIEAPHRAIKFAMEPGDSLLLYTDCLLESRNEQGQPFGAANLLTAYGRAPEGPASDMLAYVVDDWRFHTESILPVDDMTAVLVKRLK